MIPSGDRALAVALALLLAACSTAGSTPTTTESALPPSELTGTIVYSAESTEGNEDIYRLDLVTGVPVRLTTAAEKEFDPDISPDGTLIAYRRNPDPDSDAADIWVMGRDGSEPRNLTNDPTLSNWGPSWTPQGRIAFSRMGAGGVLEVWTMSADGSDARRVASGWCEYPDPSPDGEELVCAGAVGARYDLFVISQSGERRPLTATPETEFGPAWSPDGEWIAFSRDLGNRWALLVIHPDGTGERQVAAEGAFPAWTPDGRLAWSGPGGINVARLDGSGFVILDYDASFISWGE